jgi:predicted CopG family antitoxin
MPEAEFVASTKTIAVSEPVWERLKDLMKKERAKSLNEVVAKLLEEARGVPSSRFGVHKRLRVRLTQQEHEEITRDTH